MAFAQRNTTVSLPSTRIMKRERERDADEDCERDGSVKINRQRGPNEDVCAMLNRVLSPHYVSYRSGPGGSKVPYLEGQNAIRLANVVLGNDRWSSQVSVVHHEVEREKDKWIVHCICTCTVTVRWADDTKTTHQDKGYGGGKAFSKKGEALELAFKEAPTDALKRALRKFGDVLGNCLYGADFRSWEKTERSKMLKERRIVTWNPEQVFYPTDADRPGAEERYAGSRTRNGVDGVAVLDAEADDFEDDDFESEYEKMMCNV
jgi:DNA recombination protein Rad52